MKKKIVFPKYSKITSIIAVIFPLTDLALSLGEKLNTYVYLFGVSNSEISAVLKILFFFFFINALAVFLHANTRFKVLSMMVTIFIAMIMIRTWVLGILFSFGNNYFEFTSDDKRHEIVVKETSILFYGYGVVYEKDSFCTMKRVGGYDTDDGFLPFTSDRYYFVWNQNDFELHYDVGNGSDTYRTITMDYIK